MTTRKVMSCSFEEGVVGNCNDFIAHCFWNVKTRVRTKTLIKHCKKIWSKKGKKGRKKSDIPLKSSVQASSPLVWKKPTHVICTRQHFTEWLPISYRMDSGGFRKVFDRTFFNKSWEDQFFPVFSTEKRRKLFKSE